MTKIAVMKIPDSSIPTGWDYVELGEVTTVVNGTTPKSANQSFWNGNIVWITPTDLGRLSDPLIRSSERMITKAGFESCNLTLIPSRSVVLSSRAPIGHLGIAAVELCTNQGCKSFIPGKDVDEWFLYYALRQSVWRLQQLGSGATFAEISKAQLERFSISLPPIEVQRRIAGALREKLATVARARESCLAKWKALRILPAAYVQQVFPHLDQPLPVGWRLSRLGDLCDGPGQYGTSHKSNSNGKGTPVLGMYHIHEGRIRLEKLSHIELPAAELSKYILRPGDILFNRTNSAELVGKTAVFDQDMEAVFASYLIRYRLKRNLADPNFVCGFINSQSGRVFIERNMSRAIGQVNISASTMHKMPIPVPDIAEQRRIAGALRRQIEMAERARSASDEELKTINALPVALLRGVFNGEP